MTLSTKGQEEKDALLTTIFRDKAVFIKPIKHPNTSGCLMFIEDHVSTVDSLVWLESTLMRNTHHTPRAYGLEFAMMLHV